MNTMKKVFFITIVCFFPFLSQAQNTKSLQECVRIAWENNISVKQAALGITRSHIDLNQAKANRIPSLNAGSSLNLSGRSVDPTSNTFVANSFYTNNYNISSNVLLYNGGIIRKNIERAKLSKESASLQTDDIKQTIGLQVANAYLNVLFTEENLSIAEKRQEITKQQLVQLNKLISAGLRPKNARFDLEATLATNEQAVISAEGSRDIARLTLNQIMRISAEETFDLVIPEVMLSTLDDPFSFTASDIYKIAAPRQPLLKNSKLNVKIAELDQNIAKAAYLPSVGIGGSVGTNYASTARSLNGGETVYIPTVIEFQGVETEVGLPSFQPNFENVPFATQLGENITYGYGLSLSIPIYTNNRNKSNVLLADLGRENAVLTDQQNQDQFRQQLEQAIIDARNAKKQYEAAEKSVEASKRALENLQSGFNQGTIDNFQLTIATNQYDNAVTQSLISKYDYIFRMKVIDFYKGKGLDF